MALIGFFPDYPYIDSGNSSPTALVYTAATGKIDVPTTPAAMYKITGELFPGFPLVSGFPITAPASTALSFHVDASGVVVSGLATDTDFVLIGELDDTVNPPYSGVLLSGRVIDFGFFEGGTTDSYDVRIRVTGGALVADYYLGKDIGLTIGSGFSTFDGTFTADFSGAANINVFAVDSIPEPSGAGTAFGLLMMPPMLRRRR